jgi:hypothetical protein
MPRLRRLLLPALLLPVLMLSAPPAGAGDDAGPDEATLKRRAHVRLGELAMIYSELAELYATNAMPREAARARETMRHLLREQAAIETWLDARLEADRPRAPAAAPQAEPRPAEPVVQPERAPSRPGSSGTSATGAATGTSAPRAAPARRSEPSTWPSSGSGATRTRPASGTATPS